MGREGHHAIVPHPARNCGDLLVFSAMQLLPDMRRRWRILILLRWNGCKIRWAPVIRTPLRWWLRSIWIICGTIQCRAYLQSLAFLGIPVERFSATSLVVVISASGRPSPVLDALAHALTTKASVVGMTNSPGSPFANYRRACCLLPGI